jgi:hypothetical protein
MDAKAVIQSQYHASLEMLRQVIESCPPELWLQSTVENPTWRVAYHALFYTHMYLHISEKEFVPWPKHRDQGQFIGHLPWPPHDPAASVQPYTNNDLIEFLDYLSKQLKGLLDSYDLDSPSGFDWLPFNKLEMQFYNLRHLQQHTGELSERLGAAGIRLDWRITGL